MDEHIELEVLRIPAWRRWVVQWDISHNAMALAFFAFTAMWQTASLHFGMVEVPAQIWYVMYFVSCIILSITATLYIVRVVIFPPSIVADFKHPRLINFFFMPVMIGALCVLTTPPFLRSRTQFIVAFYLLGAYQLGLGLYLYGEWLFGTSPTTFIHPLVFMQTIGYFLLANIGWSAFLIDQAFALFAVGCLFWLLVFITNFQHLSPALDKRSERPQPTFFLFIAPPAQAALAFVIFRKSQAALAEFETSGQAVSGLLDVAREMPWPELADAYLYIDLFLYMLMLRLFPTFWTQKFSVVWWAYIFPLSAAASSTIWKYKAQDSVFWGSLAALLTIIASAAMAVVLCFTIWSISKGGTPRNAGCLQAYYHYSTGSNASEAEME